MELVTSMKTWNYPTVIGLFLSIGVAPVLADDGPKEDPTCGAVNRAYVATFSIPQFTDTIHEVREDGTRRPFIVIWNTPTKAAARYVLSDKWEEFDRPSTSVLDRDYPKFSSCQLVDQRHASEGKVAHYSAIWRKFPFRAESEIWISADTGLILRVLRRYPGNGWQFPFETALEIFDYDLKEIAPLR